MRQLLAAGTILLPLPWALALAQPARPKTPLKPGDVLITAAVVDGFIAAFKARDRPAA